MHHQHFDNISSISSLSQIQGHHTTPTLLCCSSQFQETLHDIHTPHFPSLSLHGSQEWFQSLSFSHCVSLPTSQCILESILLHHHHHFVVVVDPFASVVAVVVFDSSSPLCTQSLKCFSCHHITSKPTQLWPLFQEIAICEHTVWLTQINFHHLFDHFQIFISSVLNHFNPPSSSSSCCCCCHCCCCSCC